MDDTRTPEVEPAPRIYDMDVVAAPYQAYERARHAGPVCHVYHPADGYPRWVATRHDAAVQLLTDARLSKNPDPVREENLAVGSPYFSEDADPLTDHMLTADPPRHTRLRRLVAPYFTPSRVRRLEPRIAGIAADLLDRVADETHWDVLPSYAMPLPHEVICEVLGVPAADRPLVQELSTALMDLSDSEQSRVRAGEAVNELREYLTALITRFRNGAAGGGLLGDMVPVSRSADRLSDRELLSMAYLLLITGHTSTTGMIAAGLAALLSHPDQLDLLRRDRTLIEPAVEEILRYDTSVLYTTQRVAVAPVEVGGLTIPVGGRAGVALGSVNHDEARCSRPERFDITRADNHHLSFGAGIHYCLGAALARAEIRIAIEAVLDHCPTLELAVPADELRWVVVGGGLGRQLGSLPVRRSR